jgi:hypothetical protein
MNVPVCPADDLTTLAWRLAAEALVEFLRAGATVDAAERVADDWRRLLTRRERIAVCAVAQAAADESGAAALAWLAAEDLDTVADLAGPPLPPLFDAGDDARWWSSFATLAERRAYALATLRSLPPGDRARIFSEVGHG